MRALRAAIQKSFRIMNKKCFSQPQSKGSPIQRETALGLKLVYSFINFEIPLPATYIRHS